MQQRRKISVSFQPRQTASAMLAHLTWEDSDLLLPIATLSNAPTLPMNRMLTTS